VPFVPFVPFVVFVVNLGFFLSVFTTLWDNRILKHKDARLKIVKYEDHYLMGQRKPSAISFDGI